VISVKAKARIVIADEREAGERALLISAILSVTRSKRVSAMATRCSMAKRWRSA